jgi:hypothetical protein
MFELLIISNKYWLSELQLDLGLFEWKEQDFNNPLLET